MQSPLPNNQSGGGNVFNPFGPRMDQNAVYAQMVTESCPFKFVLSAGGGFAMGLVFGMFMSSFEMASVDPAVQEQPLKNQLKYAAKDMGSKSLSMAKTFSVFGSVYAGTECIIEGYRAKSDLYNSSSAGCLTGAILGARAGPQAAITGCAFIGAFSTAIDYYMRKFH